VVQTQDTEMSEPPINQEDFFVYFKNLESHMEKTEQFLRGLLNPFAKVLLVQSFQEPRLVLKAIVTTDSTRERLEDASTELNGKILQDERLFGH